MSATIFVALLLGASPSLGSEATDVSVPGLTADLTARAPLTGSELSNAVHQSLRHWAHPTDQDLDQAERDFLRLADDLQRDNRIAAPTRLELQAKLRYRLADLAARIRCRCAKLKAGIAAAETATVKIPDARSGNLAQMGAGAAVAPGAQGVAGQPGANAADDNGQMLVELIQKTIAPDSWDVNGGPGVIYYWRPGRALVVSQTDDVHDLVGGVLGQMQKLGH